MTTEEVQTASKISPLAASLVRPPDPEQLQGLSIQEQRELSAKWAESALRPRSNTGPSKSTEDLAGTQAGEQEAHPKSKGVVCSITCLKDHLCLKRRPWLDHKICCVSRMVVSGDRFSYTMKPVKRPLP